MNIENSVQELMRLMEYSPSNIFHMPHNNLFRGEVFLLNYLNVNGGEAYPYEMSEAMQTSTARIAAAINNMEKKNWVQRKKAEDDRRKTVVYLTDGGREYILDCKNKAVGELTSILRQLGEQDALEYLRICKRLAEISGIISRSKFLIDGKE